MEEVGTVREPQVDLEGHVAQPLPLPQAEHLAAVGGGDPGGVHGGAGQGGVAGRADVPLDAAGEPGSVEGEAGGLHHRVAVEEFALRGLVEQRDHPAAVARQHHRPQPVVLDHDRVDPVRLAPSVVSVPDALGQDAPQRLVADLPEHVARQAGGLAVVDAVCLVERPQGWQRVVRAQLRDRQGQYVTSDRRHDDHGTATSTT